MSSELLHYEDVKFRRDGREILKGINWHVEEGENWALLGLNGAGKSTMLSMIPAYQIPTTGLLRVFGHEFGKYAWPKIKARLGFVSSADVVISGAFNSIGIYQQVEPEVRERGLQVLSEFGLSYLEGHRFHTLSAGEQRRVLLARAIMANPDLLILDEPCSGLDLPAREQFLRTVENMAREEHKPFIYVSHQIEEIMPSITHVAIIKDGLIMYKGKKRDILTDEILSDVFGIDVSVVWEKNRPWIIVK
ncbi:MAG: ATP-binding cassette domain-containing protein [Veillonella sp.]|nr:ATP-binding cassette domain-containing protein [Veillonella sp.]